MSSSRDSAVEEATKINETNSLTFELKFLLYCSHTHLAFINYYQRLHEFTQALARGSIRGPEVVEHTDRKSVGPEVEVWDWRGVPGVSRLVRYCTRISTIWMAFTLIKTLLGAQLFELAHLLTGYPGHCVILGRFYLHPTISALAGFGAATAHIIWRFFQHFRRSHMMSLFAFMLQSERDLEQFYALLMRANHRGDHSTGPTTITQQPHHDDDDTEQVKFLKHIMCYEVQLASGRVLYKLRPNRTREARSQLAARIRRAMRATTCFFVLATVPITLAIFIVVSSDWHYVQTFPGCSPHLDYLYTSGQLKSFWSFTSTRHRVVSFVFDFIENAIVWFDTGFASTYVLTMTYLMNYDILLYWRHLNARIQVNLERVHAHHDRDRAQNVLRKFRRKSPSLPLISCQATLEQKMALEERLIEVELNEIECELFDFFRQVERADKFISDVLTIVVCIWLSIVAVPGYYYLVRVSVLQVPREVRFSQSLVLLVLNVLTLRLLELNRCCMKSYHLICSLMARNQVVNGKSKVQFLKIIEFFTNRKSTTYKLFQRIPYLATTYLTLIGWSFSSLVICDSLFGRERHMFALNQLSRDSSTMATPMKPEVMILGGPKYSAFSSSL